MKFKNKFKRGAILILALILASASSFAVYAAVNYDSAKDPVVSYSGMVKYVEDILSDIRAAISDMQMQIAILQMIGPTQGGSTGGSAPSSGMLKDILDRIEDLENQVAGLQSENAALKTDLTNTKNELRSLIDELTAEFNALEKQLSDLTTSVTNLKSDVKQAKNDLSTLNKNFKQISDISTKLETVTYKVNNLTSASGDITLLKKQAAELKEQLNNVLAELSKVYDTVFVPYGATIYAKDVDDVVILILRTGSAVAVSPYTQAGTIQGLNDTTNGTDICNGETIPLYHSIMIPRGGNDGRGVTVTSLDGAYFLLGGDYTIVEP
jgi:DNA repair exonuclease SbcCD ATPase subunit